MGALMTKAFLATDAEYGIFILKYCISQKIGVGKIFIQRAADLEERLRSLANKQQNSRTVQYKRYYQTYKTWQKCAYTPLEED